MFKSKFNLYNTEWLDFVFSNRNKSYGAYELRKHYNSNLLKSLFFTATLFAAGLFTISVLIKQHHDPISIVKPQEETIVNLTEIAPPEVVHEKQVGKKTALPASSAAQKAVAAPSQVYKPVADNLVKDEPKPVTAQNTITGTQDMPGDIAGLNVPAGTAGNGTAEGTGKADNGVKTVAMLEKLPEFPGGMDAWSKFLSKNLRYPVQASEAGVSGRVYMSFIVEKDGRITDIQVLKAAGYGFDEEAKRVLKMAPQWKPGIQNGQAVRVRYTIPINFTISD